MKKPNLLFPIVILLLLIVSVSCKDENEPNQPENTVNDIDGNVYKTVNIGDQVWMAENLKVTHYQNGDQIPNFTDSTVTHDFTIGASCDYYDLPENNLVYGKLYSWYAVMDSRKLAPDGWHVATSEDWHKLIDYVGGTNDTITNMSLVGGKLKAADTVYWNSPNIGATNETGFTALPGGYRDPFNFYNQLQWGGYWWCTEEKDLFWACGWYIYNSGSWIKKDDYVKLSGLSVRCVKD